MPLLAKRLAPALGPALLIALIGLAVWPPSVRQRVIDRRYDHAPSAVELDSLAALAANGVTVRWRGSVDAVAMEAEADPVGPSARLAVVAPSGTVIRAADDLGALDSASVSRDGAAFQLPALSGPLTVTAGLELLRTRVQRPPPRTVVVLGPAGWESRFLLEALDASGHPAAARIRVGPQTYVTQGRPLPLDTARHALAVLLGAVDKPAANQIRRFVRAGGGLVLAPGAAGLDDLAPGRFGKAAARVASLSLPADREQLVTRPISRLQAGASALDETATIVRTAARRVGAGRVVQLGDEDTWRLAMASDAGRAAHARLWLQAIAIASPRDVTRPAAGDEVAPRAALVAALGPESAARGTGLPPIDWPSVVAGFLFVVLVGEWAARRLPGRA